MSSQRKKRAKALRKYKGAIAEGDEAFENQDWRHAADKWLEATMLAPSKNDTCRWRCFDGYLIIVSRRKLVEIAEKDKRAMKRISIDESEPVLFRALAMCERAYVLCNIIERRDDSATFLRRALKLIGTLPSSERNCQFSLYTRGRDSFVSAGKILNDLADELKVNLQKYPVFVPENTLKSAPRVNGLPNLMFTQRLALGGNECDWCSKPQSYKAEDELYMRCSQCKKVYYCSKKCQEKDWSEGHKDSCRKTGQIEPDDYMILVKLLSRPQLNGIMVRVVGPTGTPGRWEVALQGHAGTLSVASQNLIHIRPASVNRRLEPAS